MSKINLFCLPFAGGSKYSYRVFEQLEKYNLNIIPLEYPGRGARLHEELIADIEELVGDIYSQIKTKIEEGPYVIFGHSMGALINYLLTIKIKENNNRKPEHIFLSGAVAPSAYCRKNRNWHLLPRDSFIRKLEELEGCPPEILHDKSFFDFIEPILRNDFKAIETYVYKGRPPLNIPMTVIKGSDEEMEAEDVIAWEKESSFPVDFFTLQGKHFFIFSHPDKIIEIISQKLKIFPKKVFALS